MPNKTENDAFVRMCLAKKGYLVPPVTYEFLKALELYATRFAEEVAEERRKKERELYG